MSLASDPPKRIELQAGDCAEVHLVCYDEANAKALLELMVDRRTRAEVAEARVEELEARLRESEAAVREAVARADYYQAQAEVERAKRPGFFESHVGGCVGIGAVWDGTDVSGGFVAAYGWKF